MSYKLRLILIVVDQVTSPLVCGCRQGY